MRPAVRPSVSLATLLAIPALAMPALAQAQGSVAVQGTVTATDGGVPLANARVALLAPARVVLTNQAGRYALRSLPAGHYDAAGLRASATRPCAARSTSCRGRRRRSTSRSRRDRCCSPAS